MLRSEHVADCLAADRSPLVYVGHFFRALGWALSGLAAPGKGPKGGPCFPTLASAPGGVEIATATMTAQGKTSSRLNVSLLS